MKRPIITIDRDKCNGCTLCTTACAEGALVMDEENKAVLVKEIYCDGLGACLDVCPTDALKVVEMECDEYNAQATYEYVKETKGEDAASEVHGHGHAHPVKAHSHGGGCPGSMARDLSKNPSAASAQNTAPVGTVPSELSQWPIQLHLVSPMAPYFNECDLLIAADCTAFSIGAFHNELLKGKKLIIACPKLDDTSKYIDKIAEIIKHNTIYSLTVAIMVVPCCSGLNLIVQEAIEKSGKNIALKKIVIDLEGNIL